MNKGVMTQEALDMKHTGIQAKGVILSVRPTGKIMGNYDEMELKIAITKPDDGQYKTTFKNAFPPLVLPLLQAGRVVPVFYIPDNEQKIIIGL